MTDFLMIERGTTQLIREMLQQFPAVALVGSRQCGKTTLAKTFGRHYFDIESVPERGRLDVLWDSIMEGNELAVFDEAQCWPELFARLRGAIDARRKVKGRFILLGSISPELMKQVGESLAGRMGLVELTPLHVSEMPASSDDLLWRCGGYPEGGVLEEGAGYPRWQSSYLRLMSKRDLPQWGLPSKPELTYRLFRLLAGMHGNSQNASELGAVLGLTHTTIQSYLDYLEGAFLIRRLPAYHAKITKRLVRTPKVYWRDTGLLHMLLGMTAKDDLLRMPWVGLSWEGWVIEQILAHRSALGIDTQASYFRTNDGWECDLVLESQGIRELIEIKLTTAPATEDLAKLRKIQSLIGADRLVLLTRSRENLTQGHTWMTNLRGYLAALSYSPEKSAGN
jgi:predicted AAA+ superfamily ATPase